MKYCRLHALTFQLLVCGSYFSSAAATLLTARPTGGAWKLLHVVELQEEQRVLRSKLPLNIRLLSSAGGIDATCTQADNNSPRTDPAQPTLCQQGQ